MQKTQIIIYVSDYQGIMAAKREVERLESSGYISTAFAGGWMLELPFVLEGTMP